MALKSNIRRLKGKGIALVCRMNKVFVAINAP